MELKEALKNFEIEIDTNKIYYHQTSVSAKENIIKEGYRIIKGENLASRSDILPYGIFFKEMDNIIPLGTDSKNSIQIENKLSIGKALIFKDREQIKKVLFNDSKYFKLINELDKIESNHSRDIKGYENKTDELIEMLEDREITEEQFENMCAELDHNFDIMCKENDKIIFSKVAVIKEYTNELLKGYDYLVIENDKHGFFNSSVKSIICLNLEKINVIE